MSGTHVLMAVALALVLLGTAAALFGVRKLDPSTKDLVVASIGMLALGGGIVITAVTILRGITEGGLA